MATLLKAFGSFFTKHPLAGNGLVYGTLYVGAEFSQQTITRKILTNPPQSIDRPTLGRYAVMGTFVYAPILYNWFVEISQSYKMITSSNTHSFFSRLHYFCTPRKENETFCLSKVINCCCCSLTTCATVLYRWLDKTFPGTAKRIIVKKLLLDQFLLTPPLLVIFFTGMSLMERQSSITEECRQKFVPTFARSCLFWIPAQTLNFVLVPPKFRVVYVGSCAFAWVNILCWVKRQKMTSDLKV
ncbi:uncharacterized protein LOC131205653 isoform X1 [Anopheles bellator]|uniref:uncharacterized protein LOC131205653 isoform X1 n=1 Tax=Anopheles bellator TaxID=139047 RepID=UPI0026485E01|nr:uncharacterized protein LOC131205653 isoform X1 [Anopheles bellator]XP_058053826.1 uncharacterized protein LOC131205653 isoform X1 [Anopheles bellator]XP_058053827.1 uncharacterized protein LOC131205653 isoform X1 [Anopheles bellator]XP_058053828.1 uncharacterized protein LOC131205653 isoform X1 [Anopheles bellator]XP_058053829.1 uncharacterized protein LOC131205653 isoform X1 [Anopheles bellator]